MLARNVETIATTDIVSAPDLYLRSQNHMLLLSFGRSGNSPESAATVRIVDETVAAAHHSIVTCMPTARSRIAPAYDRMAFCCRKPRTTAAPP